MQECDCGVGEQASFCAGDMAQLKVSVIETRNLCGVVDVLIELHGRTLQNGKTIETSLGRMYVPMSALLSNR
jgi:hypothetical protein